MWELFCGFEKFKDMTKKVFVGDFPWKIVKISENDESVIGYFYGCRGRFETQSAPGCIDGADVFKTPKCISYCNKRLKLSENTSKCNSPESLSWSRVLTVAIMMSAVFVWSVRIIWSILLLGNAALFLYIMSINMDNLFSYPTNVNVEVDYIDTVPFPAITICNQNLYRWAAASICFEIWGSWIRFKKVDFFRQILKKFNFKGYFINFPGKIGHLQLPLGKLF